MTAPTPAAVRAAMTPPGVSCTDEEEHAFMQEKRYSADILRDHIRAIAAAVRAEAKATRLNTVDPFMSIAVRNVEISAALLLERFADKLEGKQ